MIFLFSLESENNWLNCPVIKNTISGFYKVTSSCFICYFFWKAFWSLSICLLQCIHVFLTGLSLMHVFALRVGKGSNETRHDEHRTKVKS